MKQVPLKSFNNSFSAFCWAFGSELARVLRLSDSIRRTNLTKTRARRWWKSTKTRSDHQCLCNIVGIYLFHDRDRHNTRVQVGEMGPAEQYRGPSQRAITYVATAVSILVNKKLLFVFRMVNVELPLSTVGRANCDFLLLTIIMSREGPFETNRMRKVAGSLKGKLSSLLHLSRAPTPSSIEMDSSKLWKPCKASNWTLFSDISLKRSLTFKYFATRYGLCGWRGSCTYHSVCHGSIHCPQAPQFRCSRPSNNLVLLVAAD